MTVFPQTIDGGLACYIQLLFFFGLTSFLCQSLYNSTIPLSCFLSSCVSVVIKSCSYACSLHKYWQFLV